MSAPSTGGASRDGYGTALLEIAHDPRVVVLEADLGKSTKSCFFRDEYPERTISLGIAEQNMMLVAAGLASCGKVPFASTFAIFSERAFEQVRNGIARPGLTVHICGSHGGIHTGTDGSSAQSIEDLALYRTIPGMTVMHPCDDLSAQDHGQLLFRSRTRYFTQQVRFFQHIRIQKPNTADGLIVVGIRDPALVDQLEKVGIDLLGRCILRGLVQAVQKLPDVSEIRLSRIDAISSQLEFIFNCLQGDLSRILNR